MERNGASHRITQTRPGTTPHPGARKTRLLPPSKGGYGPMAIRADEYDRARAGQMSPDEARRVDINLDKL
jgi:hypothetical protein